MFPNIEEKPRITSRVSAWFKHHQQLERTFLETVATLQTVYLLWVMVSVGLALCSWEARISRDHN